MADRFPMPPRGAPRDDADRDDRIAALVRAAVAAMPPVDELRRLADADEIARFLGPIVAVALDGGSDERIAAVGRLLALAQASVARQRIDPRIGIAARFERALRRWERDRRRGLAPPQPDADELDRAVAVLATAADGRSAVAVDLLALTIAEAVAIAELRGSTSLEEALAALDELRPVLRDARTVARRGPDDGPPGAFEEPGATLAHVDDLAWTIERLERDPEGRDEHGVLRALWAELAAALVFAHDAYEPRADGPPRWRAVRDLALERMVVGGLRAHPAAFDRAAALALARSAALALAAQWLDAEHGDPVPLAPELADRLGSAASLCLLAAWTHVRASDDDVR